MFAPIILMKNDPKKKKNPASVPVSGSGKKKTASPAGIPKTLPLLILGAALLFTLVCRMRLLDVPLERDEGEYAYAGQQLLQGIPPFESIYHVKLPGIYAAFAVMETFFGQTHKAIHFGLLIVTILSAIVLFQIGKRIFNPLSGALAASVFCILSLSQKFQGFSANAEHFVVLPALLGILFLIRAVSPSPTNGQETNGWKRFLHQFGEGKWGSFFLSGLFLGISYTMKQHGMFFIAFSGIYFFYKWIKSKPLDWKYFFVNGFVFALGVFLPLGIICLIFLNLGLFEKFWWWTWYYPREYVSLVSWEDGLVNFKRTFNPAQGEGTGIWDIFWLLVLLAGAGIIGLIKERNWNQLFFTIGLFIFSFIAVSAGFSFYPHYFLHIAPAAGLLCASGSQFISGFFKKSNIFFLNYYLGAAVLLIFILSGIRNEKDYLFKMSGTEVARSTYGGNPFPESLDIAKYIEQNTSPEDKIAVFGSEPQIPFYAKRKSATGYLYTYEMIADHPYAHQFQEEMVKEIEAAKPKIVIMVSISASWFARRVEKVDNYIFEWSQKYINDHYTQAGIVDNGVFCWDTPQVPCRPKTSIWVGIYKRKE